MWTFFFASPLCFGSFLFLLFPDVTAGHRWFSWVCNHQGVDPVQTFREEVKRKTYLFFLFFSSFSSPCFIHTKKLHSLITSNVHYMSFLSKSINLSPLFPSSPLSFSLCFLSISASNGQMAFFLSPLPFFFLFFFPSFIISQLPWETQGPLQRSRSGTRGSDA